MKKNKKITGNALSQYSIIIVLVGLALVPVFFVTGQYLFKNFESFSSLLKGNQTETKPIITPKPNDTSKASDFNQTTEAPQQQSHSQAQIKTTSNNNGISDKIAAGQLGGKPDNPVKKCSNGTCTIDYGEFVLNGIPENFNEFIESSGTSGGTEVFAAILNQIADQLERQGAGSSAVEEFRTMANLGHEAAEIQKEIELRYRFTPVTWSGGYFCESMSYKKCVYESLVESNSYNATGNPIATTILEDLPYYVERIKNIKHNRFVTDNIKLIAEECGNNIINLNKDFGNKLSKFANGTETEEDIKNLIHYKISSETHLNSSIICKAGFNKDSGYQCRK